MNIDAQRRHGFLVCALFEWSLQHFRAFSSQIICKMSFLMTEFSSSQNFPVFLAFEFGKSFENCESAKYIKKNYVALFYYRNLGDQNTTEQYNRFVSTIKLLYEIIINSFGDPFIVSVNWKVRHHLTVAIEI